MEKRLNIKLGQDIGIDLGTTSVIAYIQGKGIVLREPSVIALDRKSQDIIAIGYEAKKMWGKNPKNIIVSKPLKDGVISNYTQTQKMLKFFIKKVLDKSFIAPRIMICVPSSVTEVEKRAVINTAYECGARDVFVIEEPIAAALGAGIDINIPYGNLVIDIGGGTTDIAVISMGKSVVSKSIKTAGNYFDSEITKYVKENFEIELGQMQAEEIKMKIGCMVPLINDIEMNVKGLNYITTKPQEVTLKSSDMYSALQMSANIIIDEITKVLEQTPAQLVTDIAERGAFLTGGGCLINGLDELISTKTNIQTIRANDPISCVAKGTGIALKDPERFRMK